MTEEAKMAKMDAVFSHGRRNRKVKKKVPSYFLQPFYEVSSHFLKFPPLHTVTLGFKIPTYELRREP
jgi:hypothetical protein